MFWRAKRDFTCAPSTFDEGLFESLPGVVLKTSGTVFFPIWTSHSVNNMYIIYIYIQKAEIFKTFLKNAFYINLTFRMLVF